ncbi:MAG: TerD family protein [Planctomycetaceae bacterium]|jgi:tellurium resistance protein TerD|nr:TerD family protein [Planctomycetaceae bacterium]
MGISLIKGANVSLSDAVPGLNKIKVGLGWDVRVTQGAAFDLDASAFMVTESGKVRGNDDFIFYNQLKSTCGSVEHTGDNRTGEGEGDDESILVTLNSVPNNIQKVVFTATIHEGDQNGQNFGQVSSAFIRIVNADDNEEIARFDLSEDASTSTTMIFGEVYRHNGAWKFRAVGQGMAGGLEAIAKQYGVNL